MITKEDLDRLRQQLVEDPRQVFITNETFQLLFSVITVWRPDLKQESEALIDEIQALSKLDPPVVFNDRRVLVLMGKYSDVMEKITEEIMLRKEYIELKEEDESLWDGYGRNVE